MKYVAIIMSLILLFACKKDDKTITTVQGTVINIGSKEPVDSVMVVALDGANNEKAQVIKYTDTNGKFIVNIEGNNPCIYLVKDGYRFVVFSEGYGSSDNFKSFMPGGNYKNEVLELWADSYFKPILKSKNQPYDDDNLWIVSLPYFIPSKYDIYEEMYHFIGLGPFLYDDYHGAIGDMYKKFKIKLTRKGKTVEHMDSVYVKSLTTYTDTIYY